MKAFCLQNMEASKYKWEKHQKVTLEVFILISIFLLNLLVKIYKIESGNYVIWDEAHFGKFSNSYLMRKFYFDVHPPLGKLMTAFSGLISNQDPSFKFNSGDVYPDSLDYCTMRRFHALVSALVPVFTYGTMRELGYSIMWCGIFSFFYIFENGMVSISRLILLDSHLLLFTVLVLYSFVRFIARKGRGDRVNLFLLGISIGLVLSVKWIGCFTTLFVGIYVIQELYRSLKYETFKVFLKKFVERALFLIVLPISIYVFWFIVHFAILVNSSSDEAQMSSLFQLKLRKDGTQELNKYVEYGFPVTIKASKMAGGNLHSHMHRYPNMAENQVTTYHHKDENDEWALQKVTDGEESVGFLAEDDVVVLMHMATRRYLETEGKPGLVSKGILVGCTENLSRSSLWRVEIASDLLKQEKNVKSMTTKFRLINTEQNCYLTSSSKSYPDWGFSQGEVLCAKRKDEGSLWNIEKNEWKTPRSVRYNEVFALRNTFSLHFFELNKAMLVVNSSFKQDEELEPARIVSKPYEWFILKRGLRMVTWDNEDRKRFYMFGNPFIWYLSSLSILVSPFILLTKVIRFKRRGLEMELLKKDFTEMFIFFVGWACHYLPFFFIGRVVYFHHYFPAMVFAILCMNYVISHSRKLIIFCALGALVTFIIYSPLTYGFKNDSSISYAKIVKSWDFI